ncbi:hypothetical protein LPY66_19870 [Dehalobacter sp. DCM]|uniref:trigger factor n=1 Tax=Dehalobacter sp. DCM TaxID=2907827 RepID=UPI003081E487|nr:hypothetical protein LPY66_19870 [Dehalobacter sp. DCM]
MSATLINATKDEATFLIQIDAKTFEKALMEEYHKATATEGKKAASAFLSNEALLAQYPDLEKIANKALEKLLPAYYMSAIKELGIQPMTFPNIMPRSNKLGEPCIIEIRVSLEPQIELEKYEGLEAHYTPVVVTEEDINENITGLRKQHNAETDDAKLLEKLPFKTIEELQAEVRNSMTSMAEEKTTLNKQEAIIKQLIVANPVELAEEVIQQQINVEMNRVTQQMGKQFLQNYMRSSGRSLDDLKKEVRPQAEMNVKKSLLLTAVADKVCVEITEEDIKKKISEQPGSFNELALDYETRRKRIEETPGALDQIKHLIRLDKATDYIISKAILHEDQPIRVIDSLPEYMKIQ